jgi:hypothetical protein
VCLLCLVCLCSLYFCSLPWVTKDTYLNNSSKKNRNETKKAKTKPSMITVMTPAAACLRGPALPLRRRRRRDAIEFACVDTVVTGVTGEGGRGGARSNGTSKQRRSEAPAAHQQLTASQWNENIEHRRNIVSSCESTGRVLYVTSKTVCSTSSLLGKIGKPSKHSEAQRNQRCKIREISNMTKLHLRNKKNRS